MTFAQTAFLVVLNALTTIVIASIVRSGLGKLIIDASAIKKEMRRVAVISAHLETQVAGSVKKAAVLESVITMGIAPRLKELERSLTIKSDDRR